ncbi:acyltransferase family protein [Naumannella halotolerans]|uniref:Peptidoglycan/LPS O-acetylase OafA/YrhL n=1 Tax=Naumannella halotolerans TaxID=993414 RepID=A0A4R7J880_9ACTN|nr:acyltransferase family protein [Naumannella halotolerans]TDT33495.1 peptidoglycan/LPS O-acetylase OafA/YrhL [Naumannella halotolerans]
MGFRSEVHGVRAVAIALVVLHHVWFGRISGGIDAFLLIGAFLLTGSFLRRHERGQDPAPVRVLAGRLVRLIPPAAVTIAAVVALTPWLLPGTLWATVWNQAVASLTFRNNFVLIDSAVDYYAGASELASPLQHFWSLSIQGQVIIAFCLGLGLLTRVRDPRAMRWLVTAAFGVLLVASFGYGVWFTAQNPTVAYFSTAARLWEFALGGLLAILVDRIRLGARTAAVVGTAGLAVLIGAAFVLPLDVRYPGVVALVPTLATVAVIVSEGGVGFTRRFLQSAPLTWLADRSYGLFLWHWPLLIFWLSLSHRPQAGVLDGAAVIAAALALAHLTHRFVEVPVKRWHPQAVRMPKWIGQTVLAGVAMVLVVGLVFSLQRWDDAEASRAAAQPASANPGARALQADYANPEEYDGVLLPLPSRLDQEWAPDIEVCPDFYYPEPVNARCKLYEPEGGANATVAVVGSSHAAQWVGALLPLATEHGWRLLQLEMADCEFRGELDEAAEDCRAFNEAATAKVIDEDADVVLTVATRSAWDGPEEILVPGYADAVQPWQEAGIDVVALRDNPRWLTNPPECLARNADAPGVCAAPLGDKLAEESPLTELAAVPGVTRMDLTFLLCPDDACQAAIGNVGVYLDGHHISRTYLESAVPQFEREWFAATGWGETGPAR